MSQPECFDQSELNDLACNIALSKELLELLASTLRRSWSLLPMFFTDIETRNLDNIFQKMK